jgi:hypothetical protein
MAPLGSIQRCASDLLTRASKFRHSIGQQSPEALGAHQQAEIKKWWPIIKAAGIKAY